jgi:NAD(P)-dependent dehydrogenase (short-subunit alcohol dehydrogenase family)
MPPNQSSPPHPPIFPTYPDLTNRVALITGIGQVGSPTSTTWGNGAATARLLAHNCVKIFGCDLSLSAAERTRSRLLAVYPSLDITVMAADVTSPTSVQAFVAAALAKHGQIDILINNVGMTAPGSPSTMSEETWTQQIDLNLHSVYRLSHAVLPIMERQPSGGSIINNASITALRYIGKPQIAYASAKAAVLQFTRATGAMYAHKHIRCNAVVPGLMYTPLVENLANSEKAEDREVAGRIMGHNVPMGWMGTGEDVANAVVWLASGASRYVTSQALVVDGGITESTGTGFEEMRSKL